MISAALSRRLALFALCASTLGLAACGGGGDGDSGSVQVRPLNLTSDLASLDLLRDDTATFSGVVPDALGTYTSFGAGTYTLKVRKAGDVSNLLSASYTLAKDQHYTAIVWGRETALRLTTLPEDEDAAAITEANAARIRVFNATTDSGTVDMYLTTASADISEATITQGGVAAGGLSGFRNTSSGTYRLRVTGVGDPNDVRLDIPSLVLEAKKYYTLVLTAGGSGVLLNGTLILQQGAATPLKNTKARVRVAASVNGAGNVSVSTSGTTLVGGLRSPSVGPYTLVNAGEVDLAVRVNGSVVSAGTQSFAAGSDYTLLTYGSVAASQVRVLQDDNRLPPSASRVKLRLVHGAEGQDPLTLSVDYLALAIDQPLGGSSAYASTNANSSVRLDVTSAAAVDALFSATAVNLQGQSVYTVFLLGGNSAPTGVIRKER